MSAKQRYRHRITGLVSAIEREAAEVWKDYLELVDDTPQPVAAADTPVAPATAAVVPDAQTVVDPTLAQPINPAEPTAPAPTPEVIA